MFGAPNAVIARTKRRSTSLKFEALLLSNAASTFLSAATRDVIAFRFRPDPGLAPPRPIPRDFVISNPLNFWRPRGPLSPKGQEHLSHCCEIGLALAGVDAPALRSCVLVAARCAPVRCFGRATRSQTVQGLARITSRKRERETFGTSQLKVARHQCVPRFADYRFQMGHRLYRRPCVALQADSRSVMCLKSLSPSRCLRRSSGPAAPIASLA